MRFFSIDFPSSSPSSLLGTPARRACASCFGAVIAAMGAIGFRNAIVSIEPRTAILYSAIGLPVNLAKLDIGRVEAHIVEDGDRRVLVISGDIANPTSAQHPIPPMQVTVRGKQSASLFMWTVTPPKQKLSPGETVAFNARLSSPPSEGTDVLVEFNGSALREAPKAAKNKTAERQSSDKNAKL